MTQSRDGLSLSFSSLCLLLACCERGKDRRRVRKEEEEEVAGDWAQSLHTQLKKSSTQRQSLPTCALTCVVRSVVIYSITKLKAKLATTQLQRPHINVGLTSIVRKAQAGREMLRCFYPDL